MANVLKLVGLKQETWDKIQTMADKRAVSSNAIIRKNMERITSKMTTGGRMRDEDVSHAPNGIDTRRQYGQTKFRSDSRAARLNK